MLLINLSLEGDNAWPELQGREVVLAKDIHIAGLDGGMVSGKPSVTIRLDLPDRRVVLAETSLALFLMAADGLRARYGATNALLPFKCSDCGREIEPGTEEETDPDSIGNRLVCPTCFEKGGYLKDKTLEGSITQEQWETAKKHFDTIMDYYEELRSTPGVNVELALAITFLPLLKRWDSGERSRYLYEEMLAVE